MSDISAADLLRALSSDEPLQDWIADSVGLGPAPLAPVAPDPWACALPTPLPWLTLRCGDGPAPVMIHIVVGVPAGLVPGSGLTALRRAAYLRESRSPGPHRDFRVALLAPRAVLDDGGDRLRGFPHKIAAEDLGLRLRRVLAA